MDYLACHGRGQKLKTQSVFAFSYVVADGRWAEIEGFPIDTWIEMSRALYRPDIHKIHPASEGSSFTDGRQNPPLELQDRSGQPSGTP